MSLPMKILIWAAAILFINATSFVSGIIFGKPAVVYAFFWALFVFWATYRLIKSIERRAKK